MGEPNYKIAHIIQLINAGDLIVKYVHWNSFSDLCDLARHINL